MAPATYLAVLFCAALAAASVSAETLEEGKSLGQSLGASGAQQAPSVAESSATINSTLGHESTQGAGGGAGYDRGYTGAATYTGKLACAEGRSAFFGGLGLRVASCTVAGGNVTQLSLEACTSARDGVACQWSAPKTVLNPGSTSFGDFAVNLTCPAGGTVCEVSVRETVSQTWNADTVAEEGRQAAQAEDEGGFYDTMNTTYNDGNYRASLSAVGPQYSGCVEQVDAGLAADGIVYSCDGLQSASFDSACEETRECVRTEEQITRYAVDCVSGVDLVRQSCTTVTPTKDCEVSIEKQTYSCHNTLSIQIDSYCIPNTWQRYTESTTVDFGGFKSYFTTQKEYFCSSQNETYLRTRIVGDPTEIIIPLYVGTVSWSRETLLYGCTFRYESWHFLTGAAPPYTQSWSGCYSSNSYSQHDVTSYSCSGSQCTLIETWTHSGGFLPSSSVSISVIPNPGVRFTETWDDQCAPYENAK